MEACSAVSRSQADDRFRRSAGGVAAKMQQICRHTHIERLMINASNSISAPNADRPLPPQPSLLFDLLEEQAARIGQKTCLEFDERSLTFAQLNDEGNRLGAALQERGVKQGDLVMMMLGNRAEIAIGYVGIARIGAVAVPVNPALKGEGLAHIYHVTNASVLIAETRFVERVEAALDGRGSIKHLIAVSEETPPPNSEQWAHLIATAGRINPVKVKPSDPWAVMFTSGTTGPSKGAVEPHQMFSSLTWDAVRDQEIDATSVFYNFNPLFHLNAAVYGFGTAIMSGSKSIVRAGFPRSDLLDDLKRRKVTHLMAIGFVLMGLLAAPEAASDADNSLKKVLTIGMSPEAWAEFERRFGVSLQCGYGSSESGMVCRMEGVKAGSSGRCNDRYEMQIVDADGHPLPAGRVGEVVSRARQAFDMMLGYYNNPEATASAWQNGWFKTGDRGYLDEEGFFFFVDRVKESIKRRGENVSSFEVEAVLMKYPGIKDAAVVPYKVAAVGDEEVRAFFVLHPGAEKTFDIAELAKYCGNNMAYFMVPRYFDREYELPRNAIEKIEKYKLRDRPLTERTLDTKTLGLTVKR